MFRRIIAESPKLTAALADADWDTKFHVTADYNYRAQDVLRPAAVVGRGRRVFPRPDVFHGHLYRAALGKNGGSGGHRRASRCGRALSWWARRRYTRRLSKNLATLERMVLAFYNDDAFSVFMERNPPLQMGRAINALVAGHSNPPWPVRWRYWLFLLVCRVQRWHPVVPPDRSFDENRARRTARGAHGGSPRRQWRAARVDARSKRVRNGAARVVASPKRVGATVMRVRKGAARVRKGVKRVVASPKRVVASAMRVRKGSMRVDASPMSTHIEPL